MLPSPASPPLPEAVEQRPATGPRRSAQDRHDEARLIVKCPDQPGIVAGVTRVLFIDVVALARYMQVLSPAFLARYPARIINIHHSFLPAFVGANPHAAAHERGVKLIGATAHYVTEELDAGPIIE